MFMDSLAWGTAGGLVGFAIVVTYSLLHVQKRIRTLEGLIGDVNELLEQEAELAKPARGFTASEDWRDQIL